MKIKLSELRQIVKSIIRETSDPTPTGPSTPNLAAELAKMKNVPVRWYLDEGNTKPHMVMTIKNIIPSGDRIKIEGLWENEANVSNSIIFLACGNNFGMFKDVNNGNMKLYNTKYIEKLKALLCTKSAGGVEVTNIGDYSSTTSKAPVNVAESKRKLTKMIKEIVKESNGMTGYAGGTYTPGKGGNTAFNNAGKGGASTLPDDVFAKILPCLANFGVKGIADLEKGYPNVYKIVNKMFSDVMMGKTPQPPNMVDAGLAFTEVMSKGIDLNNVAALMQVFTCILDKMKVLNERRYY